MMEGFLVFGRIAMTCANLLSTTQEISARYEKLPAKELLSPGWSMPVISFVASTTRRNAKKRGISVFLKYFPMAKFTEDLAVAPSVSNEVLQNIYVGITLYNGVQRDRYQAAEVTHYLPMHALNGLFCIYDAIMEDSLFDYYICRGCNHQLPGYLKEYFCHDFYESSKNHELFAHSIFEDIHEDEREREYSQLYLNYQGKNGVGDSSNTPFRLYCMKLPQQRRRPQGGAGNEACWDSRNRTEISVGLTREQLLEMVEKIHQAVCSWLEIHT
jgi:hypothetical protein